MNPDLFRQSSAKALLRTIEGHEGQLTWHGVTTHVDQLEGMVKDPPVYYVLKQLVAAGYVRTEPPSGGNTATYYLTDLGRKAMAEV